MPFRRNPLDRHKTKIPIRNRVGICFLRFELFISLCLTKVKVPRNIAMLKRKVQAGNLRQ